MQQGNNGIRSGISDQTAHPIWSNFDASAIGFDKNGVTNSGVRQSDPCLPFDHKKPGFLIGIKRPIRIRREIDPLKNEMRACDQDHSSGSEASWTGLSLNRPRIGNGDSAIFVQLALPAIVKQTERHVAMLLDLGEHDAGAYGVDRAGGDEDDVAFYDRAPLSEAGNRTVPDRRAQFVWREMSFQSNGNPRL